MTNKETSEYLLQAMQHFCGDNVLRPQFKTPFVQDGWLVATDGRILVRIHPESVDADTDLLNEHERKVEAKLPNGFRLPNVSMVMPRFLGNDDRHIDREYLCNFVWQMEEWEHANPSPAILRIGEVYLTINGATRLKQAIRFLGIEFARIGYDDGNKLVLLAASEDGSQNIVQILQMSCRAPQQGEDWKLFELPLVSKPLFRIMPVDLERGRDAYTAYMARQERDREALLRAPREVYMVEMVKRAFIPVYARSEQEAQDIAACFGDEPERDWDSEWELSDTLPGIENVDEVASKYEQCLAEDGYVAWDVIRELEGKAEGKE